VEVSQVKLLSDHQMPLRLRERHSPLPPAILPTLGLSHIEPAMSKQHGKAL
jgi:hypothetical protein